MANQVVLISSAVSHALAWMAYLVVTFGLVLWPTWHDGDGEDLRVLATVLAPVAISGLGLLTVLDQGRLASSKPTSIISAALLILFCGLAILSIILIHLPLWVELTIGLIVGFLSDSPGARRRPVRCCWGLLWPCSWGLAPWPSFQWESSFFRQFWRCWPQRWRVCWPGRPRLPVGNSCISAVGSDANQLPEILFLKMWSGGYSKPPPTGGRGIARHFSCGICHYWLLIRFFVKSHLLRYLLARAQYGSCAN